MEDTVAQNDLLYLLVALGVIDGGALALWLQRDKKAEKQPKKNNLFPRTRKDFSDLLSKRNPPALGA